MQNIFLNEDALKPFLQKESINLFISHPPYFNINIDAYQGDTEKQISFAADKKKFIKRLIKVTKNMEDALAKNGSIVMIMPTSRDPDLSFIYVAEVLKKTKLQINQTLIWDYAIEGSKMGHKHGSINDTFCYMFHFSKGNPVINSTVIDKYNNPIHNLEWKLAEDNIKNQFIRLSGHVHDAIPEELSDILVRLFSKKDDLVADLFGGTGTVAVSSLKAGRHFLYNDVSITQRKVAQKRVNDYLKTAKPDED